MIRLSDLSFFFQGKVVFSYYEALPIFLHGHGSRGSHRQGQPLGDDGKEDRT
jgi:hypothetical protein